MFDWTSDPQGPAGVFHRSASLDMFDFDGIQSLQEHKASDTTDLPLEGVRVLDFTHYVAGPFGTMLLGDFGADVIKIEGPGGDRFRSYPPHDGAHPEEGGAFLWANRNKRSIEIDLKSPHGKEIILGLLEKADVVVENFATGVMDRLGLGYETLKERYPGLIYCSISAYGRKGKFSKRPGFDTVVQAESGFVSMNGYPDRPGVRTSSAVMDIGTALFSVIGILNAMVRRQRTGGGAHVEIPLFSSSLLMSGYATLQSLCTGVPTERRGNTSADSCPTGVFQCEDAEFFLHCGNSEIFVRLMRDVLGRADLAAAGKYATATGRLAHQVEIFAVLEAEFGKLAWEELNRRFTEHKVPAGKVRNVLEALRSEEAGELDMVGRIHHDTLGWIPNVRSPIRLDGVPVGGVRAAPTRGQHTRSILAEELGYSPEQVDKVLGTDAVSGG